MVVLEIESGIYIFQSDYVPSTKRAMYYRAKSVILASGRPLNECEECGKHTKRTHIHHIDKNVDNLRSDNLLVLCLKCHKDMHPERLNFGYMSDYDEVQTVSISV